MTAEEAEGSSTIAELNLRRLLVAVDGSPSSELALAAAVRAAKLDNAAITLITVEPDVSAEVLRWSSAGVPSIPTLQMEARLAAESVLRDIVARMPKEIPLTLLHRRGKPGPEIVAAADEGDYDAVILGARGAGRVTALLGSVSQYVMHRANTHVIVARD